MSAEWKLPEFVGMTVTGNTFKPPFDEVRLLANVQLVKIIKVNAQGWEMYVASCVGSQDDIAAAISKQPGVKTVQVTSLRHKQKD